MPAINLFGLLNRPSQIPVLLIQKILVWITGVIRRHRPRERSLDSLNVWTFRSVPLQHLFNLIVRHQMAEPPAQIPLPGRVPPEALWARGAVPLHPLLDHGIKALQFVGPFRCSNLRGSAAVNGLGCCRARAGVAGQGLLSSHGLLDDLCAGCGMLRLCRELSHRMEQWWRELHQLRKLHC